MVFSNYRYLGIAEEGINSVNTEKPFVSKVGANIEISYNSQLTNVLGVIQECLFKLYEKMTVSTSHLTAAKR